MTRDGVSHLRVRICGSGLIGSYHEPMGANGRVKQIGSLVTASRRMSTEPGASDVTVHVASKDTLLYTELCLRSMWRLAGRPFQLVVGDCSSTDGSQKLLRKLASEGRLTLQESAAETGHGDWIDRWRLECTTPYMVVVDSDVEFTQPDWLARLLASMGDASMLAYGVVPERTRKETRFGEPIEYTLLGRPDPCVLVLDHERTRHITAGFEWREEAGRWPPERAYDTAGYFASVLEQDGQSWATIPAPVKASFNHFGGRSWRGRSRRRRWRHLPTYVRLKITVTLLRVLDRVRPTRWSIGE